MLTVTGTTMNALPGMPSSPADGWAGKDVRRVSAVVRLLVPDHRPTPAPRSAQDGQRPAKTPAG